VWGLGKVNQFCVIIVLDVLRVTDTIEEAIPVEAREPEGSPMEGKAELMSQVLSLLLRGISQQLTDVPVARFGEHIEHVLVD
jgi:hypothetical protein